jgi:plastocyanin
VTWIRHRHGWLVTLGGAVVLGCALAVALPLGARPATTTTPRTIVLVARQMAFHVEGASATNPTIELTAGERVRFVLRNEDHGIAHDLAVPSLGLAVAPVAGVSEHTLEMSVPDRPGAHEYRCTPHAQMMRGTLRVSARN